MLRALRLPLAFVVLFTAISWPLVVHAQGEPLAPSAIITPDVAPPPVVLAPGIPSIEAAPLQFAAVLVQLAQSGKWGALVGLLVFALVWAARKFAGKLPPGKFRDATLSKWGGWGLNLAVALSAGFASLAFVGLPLSVVSVLGVIGAGVTYAFTAAGLVEFQKDIADKGSAASAAVTTKADALGILEKGPP